MHQPMFRPVRAPGMGPRGPMQQRYPGPGPGPGPRMDFRPRGLSRPQVGPSHMIRTAAPVASGNTVTLASLLLSPLNHPL